jgi:hypothetical protein
VIGLLAFGETTGALDLFGMAMFAAALVLAGMTERELN